MHKQIHLDSDKQHASDVSKAIISTILFHRLFGSLKPETNDLIGVTYPVVPSTNSLLNLKQKEVSLLIENNEVEIVVKFYEKKRKNAWFQKSQTVCWEKWTVLVKISEIGRKQSALNLERALMEIVEFVDLQKEHIPSITTTDLTPFPYEIQTRTTRTK